PTLVDYYKVDPAKITHVLPGANVTLSPEWTPPMIPGRPGIDRDLVLGFVGKDWRRKGLPFLMEVQSELAKRGHKVKIRLIGSRPSDLAANAAIEVTGFIDKYSGMERFVQLISTCDIGCLFSTSEALGISTLEFLRTGVPVAGFYHQGLKDTLLEGASFRFKPDARPEEVANAFEQFIRNDDLRHEMKGKAWNYSNEVTWVACVNHFKKLLPS
ncbi:MAG TPA: glycosyltransferase family 4 protein, partial [Cyclobacteriaceae bacterium]